MTLLPLRAKRTKHAIASLNTPRMTPRMKMFTPMMGGTPADGMSRSGSVISVASDRTVAYRNVGRYRELVDVLLEVCIVRK